MDPVIVSALIVSASAVITAAVSGRVAIIIKEMELNTKKSDKGKKLSRDDKKSTFWTWGFIGALLGVAVTLLILKLFPGIISNIPTEPKISTTTPELLPPDVLFAQNFDEGSGDGITYLGDRTVWSVIKDETGNYVLDGDNSKGNDAYPRAIWGDESWKDYELSLRIRFMNQSPQWTDGIIYFRSDNTHRSYQVDLNPYNDDVSLNYDGSSYTTLIRTSFVVDAQKWYLVTIKAEGENLLLKIDNSWVFEAKDSNRKNGNLNLVPEAGVHLQVDDIVVTLLP